MPLADARWGRFGTEWSVTVDGKECGLWRRTLREAKAMAEAEAGLRLDAEDARAAEAQQAGGAA